MPNSAPAGASRSELTRDLCLDIVALAEAKNADPTVFFSALSMAYLSSYIGIQTAAGKDVEEEQLAQAINKFNYVMCDQASWLLGVQPQVLKAELEEAQSASAPSQGAIILP